MPERVANETPRFNVSNSLLMTPDKVIWQHKVKLSINDLGAIRKCLEALTNNNGRIKLEDEKKENIKPYTKK